MPSTSLESAFVSCDTDGDRDCIIDAAYRCLSEPHTGAVPMAAVLARAGLSTRAFYRHFESKDELFLAMLRDEGDALAGRLQRIAEDCSGSAVDQLKAWIAEIFELAQDPRLRMRAMVLDSDEVRAAPGYRNARKCWHLAREQSLSVILRRGLRDGSFPLAQPDGDAVAIGAVVTREMIMPRADDAQQWERAADAVLDFALRALGAPTTR